MPRESGDVAASVRARLLNLARERGEEMQRLFVRYALERLLYRLGRSRHADRFALKGAMLFPVWDLPRPRATRDLDLLGVGDTSEAAIVTAFEEIWKTEVEDDGLAQGFFRHLPSCPDSALRRCDSPGVDPQDLRAATHADS